jgi:hypothetical protein
VSYGLLTSLYFGEGTNADLATPETRSLLHVPTALDEFIPAALKNGLDVVLTGNPGDGKSHLVRTLMDRGALGPAMVELDLSAKPTVAVAEAWRTARGAHRRFVLCANEGPLMELLQEMANASNLADFAEELRGQLDRLTVARSDMLPKPPRHVLLIDLADRNVLDEGLVERALSRVCDHRFLPRGTRSTESSAGRNLMLFAESSEARRRLASVLVRAGRRQGMHISFRQLWSAIAYAITAGKKESTLTVELSQGKTGLGTYALDYLVRSGARGLLLEATRRFGDPARVTDPALDEEIWTKGQPGKGRWFFDDVPVIVPATLWADGRHDEALEQHAGLKRLVALAHEAGHELVQRLAGSSDLPEIQTDISLRRLCFEGLRRLYLSGVEERGAPDWLMSGVPLWIGHTYRDMPAERRPHVAVTAVNEQEFDLLRPLRAPWLKDALGPLPPVAWLSHVESGIALRLDADLVATLVLARDSSGPMSVPEPVQRFLTRLSGWSEGRRGALLGDQSFAVLSQPRGTLLSHGRITEVADGAFTYV